MSKTKKNCKSIRFRLFFTMCFAIAIIVLFLIIVNSVVLESFYLYSKTNTVKELYIDNISISTKSENGNKILNYKNPLNFGKYQDLEKPTNDRIDFNIVNTNEENENHNYDTPTFYTDCSNPISLGFLNKDLLTNYSVSKDASSISFNGKVLQEAGINLDDINYTLNFTIHILNNLNQKFSYNMKLDVDLNGIYDGYTYKGKTTSGIEYNFFKELN